MTKLSPVRESVPTLPGLHLSHRGKAWDTYELEHGLLLSVATDALSIFDFMLNVMVERKGVILNVMSVYMFRYLQSLGYRTHLVAAGSAIDKYLPEHLRGNPDLQARARVVRRLDMYPIEFVIRSHFVKASSSFKSYDIERGGTVCGHELPPGLQDGDRLPALLDTPTSKAMEGHDEPRDYKEVRRRHPNMSAMVMEAYQAISTLLEERGIVMADSKLEGGRCPWNGLDHMGDEIFTPDCSRFWDLQQWLETQAFPEHTAPPSYDKQFVRAEGIRLGINNLDPMNPEHVDRVQATPLSDGVLEKTSALYHEIARRAMATDPFHFLEHELGVEGYI